MADESSRGDSLKNGLSLSSKKQTQSQWRIQSSQPTSSKGLRISDMMTPNSSILNNIMMFKNPLLTQKFSDFMLDDDNKLRGPAQETSTAKLDQSRDNDDDMKSDFSEAGSEPDAIRSRIQQILGPVAAANLTIEHNSICQNGAKDDMYGSGNSTLLSIEEQKEPGQYLDPGGTNPQQFKKSGSFLATYNTGNSGGRGGTLNSSTKKHPRQPMLSENFLKKYDQMQAVAASSSKKASQRRSPEPGQLLGQSNKSKHTMVRKLPTSPLTHRQNQDLTRSKLNPGKNVAAEHPLKIQMQRQPLNDSSLMGSSTGGWTQRGLQNVRSHGNVHNLTEKVMTEQTNQNSQARKRDHKFKPLASMVEPKLPGLQPNVKKGQPTTENNKKFKMDYGKLALNAPNAMQRYLLFKFKKEIYIEGQGKYEITLTNLIDPRTKSQKSILPSMMSVQNQNAMRVAIAKRQIQKSIGHVQQMQKPARQRIMRDPYAGLPYKRKQCQGVEEIVEILQRKLLQHFNKLKLESVTYKRERQEKRHLKLIQVEGIFKRKQIMNKMQAFNELKSVCREQISWEKTRFSGDQTTQMQSNIMSIHNQLLKQQESQMIKGYKSMRQADSSMVSKQFDKSISQLVNETDYETMENAVNILDSRFLKITSHYFFKWKLVMQLTKMSSNESGAQTPGIRERALSDATDSKRGDIQYTALETDENTGANIKQLMSQFNKISVRRITETQGTDDSARPSFADNLADMEDATMRRPSMDERERSESNMNLTFDLPNDISIIQKDGDDYEMLHFADNSFDCKDDMNSARESDAAQPGKELMNELNQIIHDLRRTQQEAIAAGGPATTNKITYHSPDKDAFVPRGSSESPEEGSDGTPVVEEMQSPQLRNSLPLNPQSTKKMQKTNDAWDKLL